MAAGFSVVRTCIRLSAKPAGKALRRAGNRRRRQQCQGWPDRDQSKKSFSIKLINALNLIVKSARPSALMSPWTNVAPPFCS